MIATMIQILIVGLAALTLVAHLLLAWGVLRDATDLKMEDPRGTALVEPLAWGVLTLITGLLGATAYWLMNRSTLRPPAPDPRRPGDAATGPTRRFPGGAPVLDPREPSGLG